MTDQLAQATRTTAAAPGEAGATLFPVHRTWKIGMAVAGIMVLLALGGVGLSTTNPEAARTYWICLVPVYGALCVATAWARTHPADGYRWPLVVRQALHWLAIALALTMDFVVRGAGQETGVAAGLNALLLLAVGCLLAGVHFEWLFSMVGLLLMATLIVVAKANEYLWLIFLVGGIVIVILLLAMRWLGKAQESTGPARSAAARS